MRLISYFLLLVIALVIVPRSIKACTVVETDIKLSDEEIRSYYRDHFKGAIFLGKVISQKEDSIALEQGFQRVTRVEVQVERVWLGKVKDNVSVLTGTSEGDCHMVFEIGGMYAFEVGDGKGFLWSTFLNTRELKTPSDREKWIAGKDRLFGPSTQPDKVKL